MYLNIKLMYSKIECSSLEKRREDKVTTLLLSFQYINVWSDKLD